MRKRREPEPKPADEDTLVVRGVPQWEEDYDLRYEGTPAEVASYIADLWTDQRPKTPERIWELLGVDPWGHPALAGAVWITGNKPTKRVTRMLPLSRVAKGRKPPPAPERKPYRQLAPSTKRRLRRQFEKVAAYLPGTEEATERAVAEWHENATPDELGRAYGTLTGKEYVREYRARRASAGYDKQLVRALKRPLYANHLAVILQFTQYAKRHHPTLWKRAWRPISAYLMDEQNTWFKLWVGPT